MKSLKVGGLRTFGPTGTTGTTAPFAWGQEF